MSDGNIELEKDEQLYTINQIYTQRLLVGGKPRTAIFLKKMVAEEEVPDHGTMDNQWKSKLYKLSEVDAAYATYNQRVWGGKDNDSTNEPSNRNLIQEKLKEQVDRLRQDKILADLKIEEMRKNLISADEIKKFLQFRYEIENAILRRILFINAPIELTGITIPQARIKCEDYYNSVQSVMRETLELYNVDGNILDNEVIKATLEKLNNAFLPPSKTE